MGIVTWVVGYCAAVLVSVVVLIRVRPEWLLVRGGGSGDDPLAGLTPAERREYAELGRWPALHPVARPALAELSRRRMAERHGDKSTYAFVPEAEYLLRAFLAPITLLFALPLSIAVRGAVASVNTKVTARAAIEQELSAARKEIDELLARDK